MQKNDLRQSAFRTFGTAEDKKMIVAAIHINDPADTADPRRKNDPGSGASEQEALPKILFLYNAAA
ncbi:hypothetical protein A8C56_06460 [Niabella ginsenosidivorans]|uniref:Uncharacterized protein n=1 Tax=Niabella ginsenosidivorans TaxID=1176587 RepID=A0A1A9I004_9BACT|nr:hypothetical protein A8C56_06460 [Niabella ginsenosidivorans]